MLNQYQIEEMHRRLKGNEDIHYVLDTLTIRLDQSEYKAMFECISRAYEDLITYKIAKENLRRLFLSYVIEHYNNDCIDDDDEPDSMFGYYNMADGSEFREGRISMHALYKLYDWDRVTTKYAGTGL